MHSTSEQLQWSNENDRTWKCSAWTTIYGLATELKSKSEWNRWCFHCTDWYTHTHTSSEDTHRTKIWNSLFGWHQHLSAKKSLIIFLFSFVCKNKLLILTIWDTISKLKSNVWNEARKEFLVQMNAAICTLRMANTMISHINTIQLIPSWCRCASLPYQISASRFGITTVPFC